ncbi:beta-1,4-glucuronyltransferase 1 isoform X3 [Zophobas morio]|uniref:beta-1,4-glucuronyltransferase 1 isoform X3 n=1 Tax=Zophobas morio TaxID=2755281 RepID=UPI0030835138
MPPMEHKHSGCRLPLHLQHHPHPQAHVQPRVPPPRARPPAAEGGQVRPPAARLLQERADLPAGSAPRPLGRPPPVQALRQHPRRRALRLPQRRPPHLPGHPELPREDGLVDRGERQLGRAHLAGDVRRQRRRAQRAAALHPVPAGVQRQNPGTNRLAEMSCANPISALQHLVKQYLTSTTKWRKKLPYPQNHLRNLARKNCQSKFVFLTDVDIIPSRGMAEKLDVFLETAKCAGLCAYVIPTYEIDERVRFPPNKTELVRLANKGLARPFHHKVFIYNQFATNFTKWQNTADPVQEVHVSHTVTNFEFLYEPFYVAPDTVPPHDERFVGYGYTRNSQVYEMFVAGYEFLVLSPIFTCHWGLQVKKTRPPWREHQNNLNRKQFDGFKREIFAKYDKDPLNMMSKRKN